MPIYENNFRKAIFPEANSVRKLFFYNRIFFRDHCDQDLIFPAADFSGNNFTQHPIVHLENFLRGPVFSAHCFQVINFLSSKFSRCQLSKMRFPWDQYCVDTIFRMANFLLGSWSPGPNFPRSQCSPEPYCYNVKIL